MNNGIKNKLKELMGKEVTLYFHDYGISIRYPSIENPDYWNGKVLRFEEDDCIVFGDDTDERIISIDFISHIPIKKE